MSIFQRIKLTHPNISDNAFIIEVAASKRNGYQAFSLLDQKCGVRVTSIVLSYFLGEVNKQLRTEEKKYKVDLHGAELWKWENL